MTSFLTWVSPIIFVLLWSTGYIGAKYGMVGAEPFTFLAIRFALTLLVLGAILFLISKPQIPDRREFCHSIIIGMLMQGLYLGGVFWAIYHGMPAGIAALIVALQPFTTALVAMVLLGERLGWRRLLFFVLALSGIVIVLFPDLHFAQAIPGVTLATFASVFIAMAAISVGAVYQKRVITKLDLLTATFAQFVGGLFLAVSLSVLLEDQTISWSVQLVLSMAWLVLVLSVGAVGLLLFLIRKGDSASVASLFFLVPVVSLMLAYLLFDEQLTGVQVLASLLVAASVAMASRVSIKP